MPIEVELPDGAIVEFPDGTDNATMEKALGQYAQKTSFGNVTSGGGKYVQDKKATQAALDARPRPGGSQSLMARTARNLGGLPLEEGIIGLGKSMDTTYRGIKQLATGAAGASRGLKGLLLRSVGADDAARVQEGYADQLARSTERQRAEEVALRQTDESGGLNRSPGATAGNIVGTAGQIIGPGAALRGTLAGRALLPTSLAGNALLGGVVGASQPVAQDGERGLHGLVGTATGFGGALVPKVVVAVGRPVVGALRRLAGQYVPTSAERAAGEAILREAGGAPLTVTQSAVPGVNRTLGEATMNPGVMALENTMRSGNRAAFDQIDTANNIARVRALEDIAGTDAQMAAAESARDATSGALRDQAFKEGAATAAQAQQNRALMLDKSGGLGPLRERVGAIAASNASRPSVQSAITDVSRALSKAGDSVESLYGVRQYIGDLLSGKAGADKGYAMAASRELMHIRDLVDQQLAARAPSFPAYLSAFRDASKPINRMQVGREVIERGSAAVPDEVGIARLTPGQFSKVSGDLDTVAQRATGFAKAKASDILSADDLASIRAIQDDLQRQFKRQSSATLGSQTAERGEIGKRVMVQGVGRVVPFAGKAVEFFEEQASARVKERLAFLVANPAQAQRVLAALNPRDRAYVSRALSQLSMRSGNVAAPALAE